MRATTQPPQGGNGDTGNSANGAVAGPHATDSNHSTAENTNPQIDEGTPSGMPLDTAEGAQGCTLAQYAAMKILPPGWLREWFDLSEVRLNRLPALRMPYFAEDGQTVLATRFRTALVKSTTGLQRFRWKSGDHVTVYGQWLLPVIRERSEVLLVEGESDTHTAWFHDVPTLSAPGASVFDDERLAPLLDGIATIYIIVEPDTGGEAVRKWLTKSKLNDRVCVIDLAARTGHKDLSALHVALKADKEAFAVAWEQVKASARPWAEIAAEERTREASTAWAVCKNLAAERDILSVFADELATAGVAGERRNAQLLYLALTSRFLERPVSLIMKGPSSAGKSYTTERVLAYFPEAAFYTLSGVSEKTLVYSDEPISHRFLVFYEAAGLSSDFATYLLRSLLSEGKIRYETTEKTSDGGLKARMIEREGPTGAIITTTAIALHPENETRMLSLLVNDTPDQTKAVLLAQAREQRSEQDYTPWHALQVWLASAEHRVTIPYVVQLAEAIPPIAVRLRRDFTHVLNLIRAHAILHQASRKRDADGRIVATVEDYITIRELVHDLVANGVEASVPPNVRQTVNAVDTHADGSANGSGITYTQIAKVLGLEKSSAMRRAKECMERGYLRNLEDSRGRPARIVIGDPLPEDRHVLPLADMLRMSTVPSAAESTP